jgi:hypothetical protein
MAKSKRARRVQPKLEKQPRTVSNVATPAQAGRPGSNGSAPAALNVAEAATPSRRNLVDFTGEYYYVYAELRNILVIAILMFLVMAGLSYFI